MRTSPLLSAVQVGPQGQVTIPVPLQAASSGPRAPIETTTVFAHFF